MRVTRFVVLGAVLIAVLIAVVWRRTRVPVAGPNVAEAPVASSVATQQGDQQATKIHAHNLILRKGPDFRVYVRWLDGQLTRTRKNGNPSLGDPESFVLEIHSGVLRANIGDIGHFLNTALTNAPLKNIVLLADGDRLKLTGTLHKIVPLPVQISAEVSAMPDDRIRLHVVKLDVLKVPMKGLLGLFKVSLNDLVKTNIEGLNVTGNDLVLDTKKLLPAPHIRGNLTAVRVVSPDIKEVFGNASEDLERVEGWRNFLRLRGGVLDFGKLTMNGVDLMMIDISDDPWFDLDLVNYQAQLSAGYSRMTAESGLQIFMPDRREVAATSGSGDTSVEWFKNRKIPPPPGILKAAH